MRAAIRISLFSKYSLPECSESAMTVYLRPKYYIAFGEKCKIVAVCLKSILGQGSQPCTINILDLMILVHV